MSTTIRNLTLSVAIDMDNSGVDEDELIESLCKALRPVIKEWYEEAKSLGVRWEPDLG